jgi:2-phospho-L-lactate guanylyltransferase (CobY/MobA/RfbA family)
MIFALLPVKILSNAKQRLAGHLTAAQRETLARKMYEQTLSALLEAKGIDRIVVVTSDPDAALERAGFRRARTIQPQCFGRCRV